MLIVVALFCLIVIVDAINTYRKSSRLSLITFILLIVGVVFCIVMVYRGQELNGADWAQILLMIGLVTITAVYASSTARQAIASVKMAEEMREQRHGTVRPIIDIRRVQEGVRALGEAAVAASGQMPEALECQLRNIGLGPALDVSSVVCPPDVSCRQHLFGTIGVKEVTDFYRLSTEQKDGSRHILVSYFDVYGRRCESRRKVTLSNRGLELGHLEVEQFP